ncbi:hypothetical protein KL933_002315 [Ogataea haglerorum]|uniref:Sulfhydryl oxidase n=1 Tax=Ogataea haglerorum TaxID=1937702 RepID=A0AAN6D775_9ASCO|nr:hypothetical protein KL915_004949 [Ogataea haglerorum]KAG7692680.1 hypothetical protein KL951_004927 [Ogataea haglerorum]KAG7702899.1 hypothetical protein KL950_004977 [Ogataea haglerorum]KAG7702998.1 hypothetical protein KL914_005003 [Ogataea haglerorum]KAG7718953.1 hypothetical protein KL913_001951 [Ogataea haglerorum]
MNISRLLRSYKKSPGVVFGTTVILVILVFALANNSLSESHLDAPVPISQKTQPVEAKNSVPFMPKMSNETLKAELGNASWKLFHTILARYPENPTPEQKQHLADYIRSFALVYPCGDCARHFAVLLEKYPPQLSSRKTAALWGCHIHNQVNLRLHKQEYDCSTILEDYDCGCGQDEAEELQENDTKEHLASIKLESKEQMLIRSYEATILGRSKYDTVETMEFNAQRSPFKASGSSTDPEHEKLLRIVQLNKMKTMKLERLNQYNNRLKQELARERINASNSSLMIIKYTETTRDGLIPELWGPSESRYSEKQQVRAAKQESRCCTIV